MMKIQRNLKWQTEKLLELARRFYATSSIGGESRDNRNKDTNLEATEKNIASAILEKKINRNISSAVDVEEISALKWARKQFRSVPEGLLRKLFKKRQVFIEDSNGFRKAKEADIVPVGSSISLPSFIDLESPQNSGNSDNNRLFSREISWMQSLILYKDQHVLVINKPPGLAVQGGLEIKQSVDSLMRDSLKFESNDSPRLVHRLDKDTSGCLLLGRTAQSTRVLHELFKSQTHSAVDRQAEKHKAIRKVYWAMVAGVPEKRSGTISEALEKVVFGADDNKSDRIIVSSRKKRLGSEEDASWEMPAVTKYRVLSTSKEGFSWLELEPITGRRHQLRVHCSDVLHLPIVGDFKYGNWASDKWQVHSEGEGPFAHGKDSMPASLVGLQGMKPVEGSVFRRKPFLHLHCVSLRFPDLESEFGRGVDRVDRMITVEAPLPPHMASAWDKFGCVYTA